MRLRRQIGGAQDLRSVVRAMKAQAAARVGQCERASTSIAAYADAVELGLGAALRATGRLAPLRRRAGAPPEIGSRAVVFAVVFGSDQGLVGRFNEIVAEFAARSLAARPDAPRVWAVGERVRDALEAAGVPVLEAVPVPVGAQGIAGRVTSLLARILDPPQRHAATDGAATLHLFYNRPAAGGSSACEPVAQRLLPLDEDWERAAASRRWPTALPPQVLGREGQTLRALIREHLFVSLFRACADSMAGENASRLAAMERADRNIDDRLQALRRSFHRLRQGRIDGELSDVVAGFRALGDPAPAPPRR
jgi:F-type H+-transporting ATPase subunit gamma